MPRINELFEKVRGSYWFTELDLFSGYYQIPMATDSIRLITFGTNFSTFAFTVMPFGLVGAPATFQKIMDEVLRDFYEEFTSVYLDNILISSKNFGEHLLHLRKIFERLRQLRFSLNPKKCKFAFKSIETLGFVINGSDIKVVETKIKAIQDFPSSRNINELCSFLGMCNYYRQFIQSFSTL